MPLAQAYAIENIRPLTQSELWDSLFHHLRFQVTFYNQAGNLKMTKNILDIIHQAQPRYLDQNGLAGLRRRLRLPFYASLRQITT